LKWKPVYIIGNTSSPVASVLRPAGFENARGVISSACLKDPFDLTRKDDEDVRAWSAFMSTYMPDADRTRVLVVNARLAIWGLKTRHEDVRTTDGSAQNVLRSASWNIGHVGHLGHL
jgi:hypothetical protein